MTLSPRKRERLSAFLGELPVAAALKLFSALEADRAAGGKDIPHDAILGDLRRKLIERGSPPVRRPSAKRTFFDPFEDFFVTLRTGKKRRAQIARTTLDPLWRVMMTDPALTETAMAAAALDDAYAGEGDVKPLERAMFLAAEAGLGRLAARVRESDAARRELVEDLGGEAAYADFEEIRLLLEGAEALRTLRVVVPSSSPSLTEEQYYDLRQLFLSAYEQSPATGAYLLLALKGRLEAPWRALGVYYHLAQSADERLAGARDTVMALPESLFEDLENMARALERAGTQELNAKTAAARLSWFTDYAEGLSRQAARAGDNVFLNRIEACRDIAGEAHARFVEQALTALRAALPVRKAGGSSRLVSPRPDISKALAPDVIDDAHAAVGLLSDAPAEARRLGADPGLAQKVLEEATEKARVYANDLVAEIRAAEGGERAAAKHLLEQTLSVVSPLLKSDEIGLIRDRAAAAAVTV
ncbi:hypothetical protein [Hyphococcus luteus]|uniref:Uncharacterized protein n=1 Tax=Hyphococcus luteus TaxID=2058213 RepID=A0A2S7K426_9PROT|nr:hypothetical protein [Marinicaulis flavus]PQA87255.1 hypothetical protein CW354_12540 [Marinicaulis flavus]